MGMSERAGSEKRVERKERDSTPQEGDAMNRYIDLRIGAHDALMSDEERKDFAQRLIDLVKILNEGKGIDPEFSRDLLLQVRVVEKDYLLIKHAAEAVKQLERESRGDVLVPHVYRNAVDLINTALKSGVPASALKPFERPIQEYLHRVRSQSG